MSPPGAPVLVIGGANLDTVARTSVAPVPGTSNPGHTRRTPGGVGRNVAESLARLGTPVRLIAQVGHDPAGDEILAGLAEVGVQTGLVTRTSLPTGSYTAVLGDDGELLVGVADMTGIDSLGSDLVDSDAVADASWIVLDGNLPVATIRLALDLATQVQVPVVLDPVGVAKASRLADLDLPVHTLTPNLGELAALLGHSQAGSQADPAADAARLHQRGVACVWLREGAEGSRLFRAGLPEHRLPARPATVVDVTGAGDAMLAGYVHRLRQGDSVEQAAAYGAAVARLTLAVPTTVVADLSEDRVRRELDRSTDETERG